MKKRSTARAILLSVYHFVCFFLIMAFLITCCMLLFLNVMSRRMDISFTEDNVRSAAVITFANMLLLCLACTVIDAVRRKITVDRPVKAIVRAAERIAEGDYSVRIPPLNGLGRSDGLDEIVDCYNQMAGELAGIESMQSDFIANVSHELKNPLAVMQNYGTLLQSADLPEEERIRYAAAISDASRRLAGLVTNILKLNKLENQQIYPAAERYDLGEQLCACLLDFENTWEEKGIDVVTHIAEDVTISADPELLSLVWNNLLSNAFKFTDDHGRVTVTLTATPQHAVVQVTDTGCGMTPEVGAHIFEKFYQGDPSRATRGNGLGLALVKRVVEIVHGEIAVSSVAGEGTAFTVTIQRGNDNEV